MTPVRLTRAQAQARTREDLLDAAEREFARRGYDGASVASVAHDAGYSHGAVYSNFASKEDLLLALYERMVARRVSEIDAGPDERRSVAEDARAGVDGWLAHLGAEPDAFLLRLEFTVRAARDPAFRRRLAERVRAVPLAMSRAYERIGEPLELPAPELALGLQALSLGLALETLADPDAVRPGLGGELASRLVRGLTGGDPATPR